MAGLEVQAAFPEVLLGKQHFRTLADQLQGHRRVGRELREEPLAVLGVRALADRRRQVGLAVSLERQTAAGPFLLLDRISVVLVGLAGALLDFQRRVDLQTSADCRTEADQTPLEVQGALGDPEASLKVRTSEVQRRRAVGFLGHCQRD